MPYRDMQPSQVRAGAGGAVPPHHSVSTPLEELEAPAAADTVSEVPQPPTDHGSAVSARKHAMNDQEHHARRNGVIVSHGWHQNDQGILGLAMAYSFGLVTLRCSREIAPRRAPPYRPPPTWGGRFSFVGKWNDRPLRPST
jgi:hypothetical protein